MACNDTIWDGRGMRGVNGCSCCSPATSWHMMPRMPGTKRIELCSTQAHDLGVLWHHHPSHKTKLTVWSAGLSLPSVRMGPQVTCKRKECKAPNSTHKTHNQLGTLQIEFLLAHVSRDSGKLYRIIAHDMGLTHRPATTLSEMVAACSVWTAASCCSLATSWHMMPRMLGTKRNRTRVWKLCWDGSTVRLRHMTWEFALNMRYHLHPTRPTDHLSQPHHVFYPVLAQGPEQHISTRSQSENRIAAFA